MQDTLPSVDPLHDLIHVLNRLREQVDTFVSLLREEEAVIRRLSFDGLTEINATKQRLLADIHALEAQRTGLIGRLADGWAMPPHTIGLSDIAERAGREDASRLQHLQRQLGEAIALAEDKNRYLALLVGRLLEFFGESMQVCRPASRGTVLYSASGTLQSNAAEAGLLERRE